MRPPILAAVLALACAAHSPAEEGGGPRGDPERGRDVFLNHGFGAGGLPAESFRRLEPFYRLADPWLRLGLERLPGRDAANADLPYYLSVREVDGVEVATNNCMTCHVGELLGSPVLGLGTTSRDFTGWQVPFVLLARMGVWTQSEREAYGRWRDRALGIAPYARTTTRGTNPADHFAGYLWAHRDPETLAWREDPALPLPPKTVLEVDVPPLWRVKKKEHLYYTGGGRGDPARLVMSALVLFTDSVAAAESEVENFRDMMAFLRTLEPPKFPWPVDPARAELGRTVFERTCSGCHGTYGPDGVYPNKIVDADVVGTDPSLAAADHEYREYLDWYRRSWFGLSSELVETGGYIAPPLDGVWATAPFFHNGSVPTLYHVLSSSERPKYWRRSFDSNDFDPRRVGWRFERLRTGRRFRLLPHDRAEIYDTTWPGLSNQGHRFGDALTDEERFDVIEYLKTL